MRPIDLHDDSLFGDPDARNPLEQDGLKRYFLEPPGYNSVLMGSKTIIVGRKGVGKTAIRTKLSQLWESVIHVDIEPLVPNHKLFKLFAEAMESDGKASFSSYEYVWRSYIIAAVLHKLLSERLLGFGDSSSAAKYVELVMPSNARNLASRISEISIGFGQLLNASVGLEGSQIVRILPTEVEIPVMLGIIRRACQTHGRRIVAMIDRVDQQLEEPLLGQLFHQYARNLGGLCLAAAWLASKIEKQFFSVYVFVRQDLLEEFMLVLHSATEFEGLIYNIPWRLDQLMDIVGTRIAAASERGYNPAWDYEKKRNVFFSDQIFYAPFDKFGADNIDLWRYLMLHTHMRPRDIIMYCNFCRVEASASAKNKIDGASLNRATHEYSKRRYQDIVATNRWMVAGFQDFIDSFRRTTLRFSRDSLLTHIATAVKRHNVADITVDAKLGGDSERLLKLLYRTGFIVASSPGDMRLPYLAHYIEPYLDVSQQLEWLVHPAYLREMCDGMKPPNLRQYLGL